MHAAEVTTQSRNAVNRKTLDTLKECLSAPSIDPRASTNLILSDAVLLAHVLGLADRSGACSDSGLSDCVVICGKSRLLRLCRLLRQQALTDTKQSRQIRHISDTRPKLVC
jgi:hypothetical protein